MRGIRPEERALIDEMSRGHPSCPGSGGRKLTAEEILVVQDMVKRGIVVLVPCEGCRGQHVKETPRAYEALELQRLANE